jgi:hypothetical protein
MEKSVTSQGNRQKKPVFDVFLEIRIFNTKKIHSKIFDWYCTLSADHFILHITNPWSKMNSSGFIPFCHLSSNTYIKHTQIRITWPGIVLHNFFSSKLFHREHYIFFFKKKKKRKFKKIKSRSKVDNFFFKLGER